MRLLIAAREDAPPLALTPQAAPARFEPRYARTSTLQFSALPHGRRESTVLTVAQCRANKGNGRSRVSPAIASGQGSWAVTLTSGEISCSKSQRSTGADNGDDRIR